ncbi:MAG: twin-arginine translocase subunit TatC [Paludibacteraceae bacterium]|nr:twin-arginine translocase subunit TatC [Paludibacteraceae bacterium]
MSDDNQMMTFGGHLEVLRRMLFRILIVAAILAVMIFCFKDWTFSMLLAPSESDFCLYRWIESFFALVGYDFRFTNFEVDLIATDLSSQFMTHISTSLYLGLLSASPYILFELFRFISPALYDNERRYSIPFLLTIYALFVIGVLMSYYILFPISFRFLGTYSVAAKVHSTITLDSYVSTFVTLTLVMGVIFQLPVVAFLLAKLGIIESAMLAKYRRHALLIIMIVAAIITPPDLMTLVLVTIPLYVLYEISIVVARRVEKR